MQPPRILTRVRSLFGGGARSRIESAPQRREAAPSPPTRVCLVTAEFHGLFKNGGIGTANTGLALKLARAGAEVVVVFVDSDAANHKEKGGDLAQLEASYRERGVKLEMLPRHPQLPQGADGHLAASYSVYAYLQARSFDVVFFNECGGQAYYPLLAKRAGLFRDPPRMCVVTHGSLSWVLEINGQLCWGPRPIAMAYVERCSVELADEVISPSRYLVDWMKSRGWALPEATRVIQNILPIDGAPAPGPETSAAREWVFFGRLEARKGLELFCDAIDRLARTRDLSDVAITFMGKFSKIGGLHSGVYILERSRTWKARLRIVPHFDQSRALDYLRRPGALAVIPSMAENSPCVVAECLGLGIPFIASDSGGTAELIAEEDRARCLFALNADALGDKLAASLEFGPEPGRLAVAREATEARWREELATQVELARAERAVARDRASAPVTPRVSICIVHAGAAEPSPRLLESLRAQTYREIEIVVVAYGPEASASLFTRPDGAVAFVAPTSDRGEAKNAAAARATGEFLLFVDEADVILKPDCVETFAGVAARLGADIVTGVPLEFDQTGAPRENWDGQLGYFPLGPAMELAAFENCLGHSVVLIATAKFQAIGGFETGVDHEIDDWLLLTRAVLAGGALEVVAIPAYWLRVKRARPFAVQQRVEDQRRILRARAGEKVATLANALESVIVWSPQSREIVLRALAGVGAVARDRATELSFVYTPTDPDSFKVFMDYCVARGRLREAHDFAEMTNPAALAPIARAAAQATAEKVAFGPVEPIGADEARWLDVTALASARVECASAPLEQAPGIACALTPPAGLTILKAPALCPVSARTFEVALARAGEGDGSASFALAVGDADAPVMIVDGRVFPGPGLRLSDWTPLSPDGAPVSARVSLDPARRERDVFVLVEATGAHLTWRRASVEASPYDIAAPSVLARDIEYSVLPRPLLDRAELLTPAPDFPVPYFAAGDPISHHPLAGRAAITRIGGAIFAGARGVAAICSVQNERARPIEFAIWARRSDEPARDEAGLAGSLGFSGWLSVRVPYQPLRIGFDLPVPAAEPLDLYLATRVTEFSDVSWCHAAWHEISVR